MVVNYHQQCTSLVTRIAKNLGLLEDASVTYIDVPRWLIDYDYFNALIQVILMVYDGR